MRLRSHPIASRQFEIHNQGVLSQLGFTALRSTPSVYQILPTPTQDHVIAGVITDDCVIMHPFDSPAKAALLDGFSKHYEYTVKDPLINFNGITLTRDRPCLETYYWYHPTPVSGEHAG